MIGTTMSAPLCGFENVPEKLVSLQDKHTMRVESISRSAAIDFFSRHSFDGLGREFLAEMLAPASLLRCLSIGDEGCPWRRRPVAVIAAACRFLALEQLVISQVLLISVDAGCISKVAGDGEVASWRRNGLGTFLMRLVEREVAAITDDLSQWRVELLADRHIVSWYEALGYTQGDLFVGQEKVCDDMRSCVAMYKRGAHRCE